MKKALFALFAGALFAFASCDNAQKPANELEGEQIDSTAIVAANTLFGQIKDAVGDEGKLNEMVGRAQVALQDYFTAGDTVNAKNYAEELQKLLSGDTKVADALKAVKTEAGKDLMAAITSVTEAAAAPAATAETLKEAVKTAGTAKLTEAATKAISAEQAAESAVKAGEEAVENAAEKVEAAKEAVENAPAKAAEAVNNAATNAKNAANEKVNNAVQSGKDAVNNKIDDVANKLKL